MLRILCAAALMLASVTFSAHASEDKIYGGTRVPTFDEYPAIPCHTSALAEPVFPENMKHGQRLVIKNGAKYTGVNFNCAFSIVRGIYHDAMVDRTDGALYTLPLGTAYWVSGWTFDTGYDFRPDSSLVIINPYIDDVFFPVGKITEDIDLWREFHVFKNGKFYFLYRDKGAKNINIYDTPPPVNPDILEDLDTEGEADEEQGTELTPEELRRLYTWCAENPDKPCIE